MLLRRSEKAFGLSSAQDRGGLISIHTWKASPGPEQRAVPVGVRAPGPEGFRGGGIAGGILLSLAMVGIVLAAQAALPDYCSQSNGCTGQDANSTNIYTRSDPNGSQDVSDWSEVQCLGGVFADGAGAVAASSLLAGTGASAGGVIMAAGPRQEI